MEYVIPNLIATMFFPTMGFIMWAFEEHEWHSDDEFKNRIRRLKEEVIDYGMAYLFWMFILIAITNFVVAVSADGKKTIGTGKVVEVFRTSTRTGAPVDYAMVNINGKDYYVYGRYHLGDEKVFKNNEVREVK